MGRESTKKKEVQSAAARGVAPAGRAPRFGKRSSQVIVGLTIGEKRERLETKNERAAARKKDKRKYYSRVIMVSFGFIILIAIVIALIATSFPQDPNQDSVVIPEPVITEAEPTIEIIDTSASTTGGKITSRMKSFIGLLELDLKSNGYQPTKAVLPTDTIREVDIYLDNYTGYFKTTIDRDPAVTAEDIDRMLRYLAEQGITNFEYIDVRIDGRAFWK